jgi:hypothetical protein
VPTLSFAYFVSQMCTRLMGCDQGSGFKDRKGRGEANIMLEGQLTCSMGLEWTGISTRAPKATTPSKGFLHLKTHMFNRCILYNTVLLLSLQV